MKILFIEDNLEFQHWVINDFLQDHDIVSSIDGSGGIKAFDEESFDLVLLDYQMDEVHGPEVIRYIRNKDGDIPVIAMSMEDRLNEELIVLGATAALAKRFVDQLPMLITEVCD